MYVFEDIFTDDSQVEYLFSRAPTSSKTRLLFGDDLFLLRFQPVVSTFGW